MPGTFPASRATTPTIGVDLRGLVGPPTGIGRYSLELLARLARRGNARFLGLAHRELHEDARALDGAGVRVEVQAAPLGVVWQQWRLPARLARGDVDLLWSPINVLPWRLPVPGVVSLHDLTPLLFPETHRLKVRLSVLPFLERTLASARRVVTGSQAIAEELRFHFPECAGRLRVVHHAAGEEFRPASEEEVAAVRVRLGAPRGYVLYVGSIEPRKNLGVLLDAWEGMRADDPEAPPLVLAGGYGWRSRGLARRIERLEGRGLIAAGRLPADELLRLFQGASLFVYPSLAEGFGLPPLEAMACGVPTLVSDRSSLPEVVGDGGLTVDALDPRAWAQAMRGVLRDASLASELGERARRRAAAFSWDRAAGEMEAVFTEALE
ncbi:MAG: glycosyltransferase family 4 protein [Thermoanaerobaculia bacterium]